MEICESIEIFYSNIENPIICPQITDKNLIKIKEQLDIMVSNHYPDTIDIKLRSVGDGASNFVYDSNRFVSGENYMYFILRYSNYKCDNLLSHL